MPEEERLPKKSEFSEWYHTLIRRTLIDQRYPTQGFLVYRPYGYETLTNCFNILNELLVQTGHRKVYFPAVIPERLMEKEKEHIKGFASEVFWVTHGGESKMEERLALRPTSETAMYTMLNLWIRSWRDLPVKIHQFCTVYRYETGHTRPLIRDREILWNEAHTSHATAKEAAEQMEIGVDIYQKLFDRLAIPVVFLDVVSGIFAGAVAAVEPYTIFPEGRGIEMGSVNNLGQRFSKAFDVKYKTESGKDEHVHQTCYGVSERILAALVAIHGDDKGLVLPPEVAPTQVVIVPIVYKENSEKVIAAVKKLEKSISERFRTHTDYREGVTPGEKFYEWEMSGVPVRVEIGPKDVERGGATLVRRDTGEKKFVDSKKIASETERMFSEIYKNLFSRAYEYFRERIKITKDKKDISKIVSDGRFSKVAWCGDAECAAELEKSLDIPFLGKEHNSKEKPKEKCLQCGNTGKFYGFMGKTY